ncbi:MAG: hypothetical protein WDN09_01940 [bacterium]
MGETEEKKSNGWFLWALLICSVIVILVSFYFFYFKKDFDFIVETSCDPLTETCFQRDCTNPDDCPPNGLSDFNRYSVSAKDYASCADEDCTSACASGEIQCEQIECTEDLTVGESCSIPVAEQHNDE